MVRNLVFLYRMSDIVKIVKAWEHSLVRNENKIEEIKNRLRYPLLEDQEGDGSIIFSQWFGVCP